jgi:imidazolonepropionase-like amidohydrolase
MRSIIQPRSLLVLVAVLWVRVPISAQSHPMTVLQNVAVVDVAAGKILSGMNVEVKNGHITGIHKSASSRKYSSKTKIIDLSGKYLMPGLVEMHAHLLLHSWDEAGNIKPRYDRGEVERTLRLLLAYGITTIRDPGSETESAVAFRRAVEKNEILGPRIFTAGRMLNTGEFNPEPFVIVKNEQEIRDEIKWQASVGVDFIKVYSGMPPEFVKIAINEAHRRGLEVIGHLQRTSWTQAAEMGIDAICHSAPWSPDYLSPADRSGYQQTLWGRVYWLENLKPDSDEITKMAELLARRRVAVDPTLIAMHTKFFGNNSFYTNSSEAALYESVFKTWAKGSFTSSWTEMQYLEAQKQWGKLLSLTKLLRDHGVLLTVGTDTPSPWIIPGVSFHQELQLLSEAGISNREIVKMATLNGAVSLNHEREFGDIKVGKNADLVVLQDNPLTNIKNLSRIEFVIKSGNVFSQKELLTVTRPESMFSSQKRMTQIGHGKKFFP